MIGRASSAAATRGPWRPLAVWSVLALLAVSALMTFVAAPIAEGCFEYCALGRSLAAFGIAVVGLVWLLGVLAVASSWGDRDPRFAAVAAILGGVFQLMSASWIFQIVHLQSDVGILGETTWTLGLGLVLPALGALARRSPPRRWPGAIAAIAALAVGGAAVATIVGGTTVHADGQRLILLAWVAVQVCTLVLAALAWRDRVVPRHLSGALVIASLPAMLAPVGFVAPGPIGYVILASLPLTALAWLLVGSAGLRAGRLGAVSATPAT